MPASAVMALGYGPARGIALLLAISVAHASVVAPLMPAADALALGSAERGWFRYGWVRGAGSTALIAAALLAGAVGVTLASGTL